MPPELSAVDPEGSVSTAARLREVATELFAERGYAGASLAEIASRLGIRKPSLYNYTRSKDALFLDLLADALDAWRDASRHALDEDGSCRERLERHLRASVGFAVESPYATGLCRVAVSHVGDDLAERVDALLDGQRRDYHSRLRAFFDEARARGEVVDQSTETLVTAWSIFLDGVLTQQVFAPPTRRAVVVEQLDALWALFWRGIAAEETA
ncbi:MAG: TetR/AcrR family transcriptional regulator [Acidobacteriota bacterium]